MGQKHTNYLDLDQTPSKAIHLENWTSLNFNPKSKMVKHYCNGSCKRHPDFDPRKLIKNGYNLGFRRCMTCGYFKTTATLCPCCNQRLRCSMRQKNHPYRKNKAQFKEY